MGEKKKHPKGKIIFWALKKWFYPLVILSVLVLPLAGSFVGRKVSIQCRRGQDESYCEVSTKGLIYPLGKERMALDTIQKVIFNLQKTHHRKRGFSTTMSALIFHRKGFVKSFDAHDYALFADHNKKWEYVKEINRFLEDRKLTSFSAEYGEHTTAILAILVLYAFAIAGILSLTLVRFKIKVDRSSNRLRLDRLVGFSLRKIHWIPLGGFEEIGADEGKRCLTIVYTDGETKPLPSLPVSGPKLKKLEDRLRGFLTGA